MASSPNQRNVCNRPAVLIGVVLILLFICAVLTKISSERAKEGAELESLLIDSKQTIDRLLRERDLTKLAKEEVETELNKLKGSKSAIQTEKNKLAEDLNKQKTELDKCKKDLGDTKGEVEKANSAKGSLEKEKNKLMEAKEELEEENKQLKEQLKSLQENTTTTATTTNAENSDIGNNAL